MNIEIFDGFGPYEDMAWELIKAADAEFVPPLSDRNSTVQQKLSGLETLHHGPVVYFDVLKKQKNIIATEDGQVLGFMSVIPDHEVALNEGSVAANYVSTVVTDRAKRKHGVARALYLKLFEMSELPVITRTWSTNYAHIGLLNKLKFDNVMTLKDDRGAGIDTVYYERNI